MTGDEFKLKIAAMHHTRASIARVFDVSSKSVRRWADMIVIPMAVQLALDAVENCDVPEQDCAYWRRKTNITQTQAANMLGVERSTIANYEAGHKPRLLIRYAMATISRRLRH